jgi:hypothetical protein
VVQLQRQQPGERPGRVVALAGARLDGCEAHVSDADRSRQRRWLAQLARGRDGSVPPQRQDRAALTPQESAAEIPERASIVSGNERSDHPRVRVVGSLPAERREFRRGVSISRCGWPAHPRLSNKPASLSPSNVSSGDPKLALSLEIAENRIEPLVLSERLCSTSQLCPVCLKMMPLCLRSALRSPASILQGV